MTDLTTNLPGSATPTVVGAFDAKTHLASLLDQVQQGQVITITRYGVPVARLTPMPETASRREPAGLLAEFRTFRLAHPLGDTTTRDLIADGRRL